MKISYIYADTTYVARQVPNNNTFIANGPQPPQIAFYLDTPAHEEDYLNINGSISSFTFPNMALLASPSVEQGPYFRLERRETGYAMYESRQNDDTYFLVCGIIIITPTQTFNITGDDIRFQIDDRIAQGPLGEPGGVLPPATGPVKTEKGVQKDTPKQSGGGMGGVIIVMVLLLLLGLVLLYLLFKGCDDDD